MNENKIRETKSSGLGVKSFFTRIDEGLKLEGLFENGLPVKFMPYILFVAFVGIVYIGNAHYSERLDSEYKSLSDQLEGLKAEYNTLKSGFMYDSKQSEIERSAAELELKANSEPPTKIIVDRREH